MVKFQGVGILEAKTMFDLCWTKQIDWINALHLGPGRYVAWEDHPHFYVDDHLDGSDAGVEAHYN